MFQGGRHIDYVVDQIVAKIIEVVKKKNKAGVTVKPFQVGCSHFDVAGAIAPGLADTPFPLCFRLRTTFGFLSTR